MTRAMKLNPSARPPVPSVNRRSPAAGSMPTVPTASPAQIMATALAVEPSESAASSSSPATHSAMYSGGPSSTATPLSQGANTMSPTIAMVPATNEETAAMVSAGPALPRLVIACPSSAVTTDDDSPGRLSRIEVVDPP
nr:hypothetical protein [Actinomadura madurae]